MGLPRCELRLALGVLTVLAICARAGDCLGAQGDAHSLQYSFNISLNEQRRCVVRVFMDRTPILNYDCDNENVLYEKQEVKTTNVSKDMKDTLKDVGDKMRRRLLHLKSRKMCGDSSTLQVGLMCQCDANGRCHGSSEFRLDGRRFLVFSPENGEYEIVEHNSTGKEIKTMWENDEEVNESLSKISMGDCKRWLHVLDRKKVLGTTAAPATAAASASPATVSATPPTVPATPTTATTTVPAASRAMNIKNNIPRISMCLFYLVIGIVIGIVISIVIGIGIGAWCIYRKRRCCSGDPESGSSSTRVRSGRRPSHRVQVLTSDPLELQPISAANGETCRRS